VSQSPINDFSERGTLRYKQGWRALNRLLHQDRSFSGNERNCAFLNTGGETASFADVSGVTGFDFADDGRGLATVDWDFDGDYDVWITNRNAPRVRFLNNNSSNTGKFIAFKLAGDGIATNRDGIGARLELHLRGGDQAVRIRTLHAGEGFLSQSSNWVHFATGNANSIEKLVVRWPGGSPQEIANLSPGKFYLIKQGKPSAEIFEPPAGRTPLVPSEQEIAQPSDGARIVIPPGLTFPKILIATAGGGTESYAPASGRPTLVNVWASWCAPCLAELTEWASNSDDLSGAGLDVMALSTDTLGNNPSPPGAAKLRLQKIAFPFPNEELSEAGLRVLNHLQQSVLDRWKPLPLPTTFLVDAEGELLVIYKGPVQAQQILHDLRLADADELQRRDAAVPFRGRWVDEQPSRSDPKRLASTLLDHNEQEAAIQYLDRSARALAPKKDLPGYAHQLGDIYFTAGVLKSTDPKRLPEAIEDFKAARDLIPNDLRFRKELAKQLVAEGLLEAAASEMVAAVKINPRDPSLGVDLAILYQRVGQHAEAKPILEALIRANPKNAVARYYLAGTLLKLDDPNGAIANYRQALTHAPRMLDAANNLAWLLSTHPQESVRSPNEAVVLAQRLCTTTKEKNPQFLDTLAVALANAGKFPDAIEAAQKAIAIFPPENNQAIDQIRQRITLFEQQNPYRE
jgi:tetratricopeptide (TPR) repeat protein